MIGTAFPELDLTEYEKTKVSYYATKDKPGVLNRIYKRSLYSQARPTQNIPTVRTVEQLQISRRSRIYGLTFTGNLDRWRLNLRNASGTAYNLKTPRTNRDPIVASMIGGSSYGSGAALGGLTPPLNFTPPIQSNSIGPTFNFEGFNYLAKTFQAFPFIVEPNWVLLPNETFIIEGTPIDITLTVGQETITPLLILNVCIYVWEFPGEDWV